MSCICTAAHKAGNYREKFGIFYGEASLNIPMSASNAVANDANAILDMQRRKWLLP